MAHIVNGPVENEEMVEAIVGFLRPLGWSEQEMKYLRPRLPRWEHVVTRDGGLWWTDRGKAGCGVSISGPLSPDWGEGILQLYAS